LIRRKDVIRILAMNKDGVTAAQILREMDLENNRHNREILGKLIRGLDKVIVTERFHPNKHHVSFINKYRLSDEVII